MIAGPPWTLPQFRTYWAERVSAMVGDSTGNDLRRERLSLQRSSLRIIIGPIAIPASGSDQDVKSSATRCCPPLNSWSWIGVPSGSAIKKKCDTDVVMIGQSGVMSAATNRS